MIIVIRDKKEVLVEEAEMRKMWFQCKKRGGDRKIAREIVSKSEPKKVL